MSQGHSAIVDLKLIIGCDELDVSKVGPERIVLAEPQLIASGTATLVLSIDGVAQRQAILIDGDRSVGRDVYYSPLDRGRKT
jgi:hypothetical protein